MLAALAIALALALGGARHVVRARHHRRVEEHIAAAMAEHEVHAADRAEHRAPFDEHLARIAIEQRTSHRLATAGHRVPQDLRARVEHKRRG